MAQQVALQQFHLLGRKVDAHVAADAGVHAVDALAPREQLFEPAAPQRDALAGGSSQTGGDLFAGHPRNIFNGEWARAQFQYGSHKSSVPPR